MYVCVCGKDDRNSSSGDSDFGTFDKHGLIVSIDAYLNSA